ncbi:MAG: hypothetical protein AB1413_07930 [Thermodesulfobacteriota bacterium]
MALVNCERVLREVLATLKKIEPPGGLTVLSYKRNRGIDLLQQEGGKIWVRERGYREEEQTSTLAELPRLLDAMLRREFPRSRKVRLYRLSGPQEVDQPRKTL